jgi:DHA1 family bicyclomycin/chloramphenicol resistance-like MFS transporter
MGTVGAALIGYAIGQRFDGTVLPYLTGMAACAVIGLLLIVLTEPKRLFAGPSGGGEQVEPHAPVEA